MNTRRPLSNPLSDDYDISELFETLDLDCHIENQNMEALLQQLEQRITQLSTNHATQINQLAANNAAQIAEMVVTNTELQRKITQLEVTQAAHQPPVNVTATEYTDIVPHFETANDIQLDAFKVIHEFNGDKRVYRSWRTQVSKLMKQIDDHKTTPKYAAALSIIRAKITGPASDILINNNTAHNIDAIIDRLDFSFADKRPLYVIESEMTSIKQESKTLQEFYDAINQSLNMVLTKITMTYKEPAEQRSLIAETQSKAIRTFITGLNSALMRTTLYGNMPDSLSKAFTIAQTIQYDNKHLHLDFKPNEQLKNAKRSNELNPNNPNFRYQAQKWNPNATPPNKQQEKPTPMEIDRSGQFIQKTQQPPNGFQQTKRTREPSLQHANGASPSYRHINKSQRVNHVDDADDLYSVYENSMDNNFDSDTTEEQPTASNEESIFLEE